MWHLKTILVLMIGSILTNACGHKIIQEPAVPNDTPVFSVLNSETTGIDFVNETKENAVMNGLMFEYIYNGGGIAAGDFNNDDLVDLYFISNLKQNQFYLNKGNIRFENTTKISRLGGGYGFPTGVTTVDINHDGLLDIYVCRSGSFDDPKILKNQLFVNKGNNTLGVPVFEEKASEYNLDISRFSTQAAFFDYDKDGDLDMFLINYGLDIYPDDLVHELIKLESANIGERLYRNDNQKFHDVTKETGIINNRIGFGLGVGLGDLNNDGWPDILVSNDYSEKDHLYLNNKNGTFREVSRIATKHLSNFSMGNDIADFNNDGWLDFVTVDMMSENNYDTKTSMSGMAPSKFNRLVEMGLHYQYMYNTLQLNNGNPTGTNVPLFSDIAQLSGLSTTDWSWAPLFFDMDNDGNLDLFVSNGIKRDFRNNDFIKVHGEKQKLISNAAKNRDRKEINRLILESLSVMPKRQKPNIFFRNNGDLTFEKMNNKWKLNTATTTNGAIYADLDNDGDLDIVGNNMDSRAVIYENQSSQLNGGNYIQIRLQGPDKNLNGIGARIIVRTQDGIQIREQYFSRGYQSSVSDILHFGIGGNNVIDELEIHWPDSSVQVLNNVMANKRIVLDHGDAIIKTKDLKDPGKSLFENISITEKVNFRHSENNFNDFDRESLLPHKMSQFGPALAVGDINNDGLDDFYVGGAHKQSGTLFLQGQDGKFSPVAKNTFEQDKHHEDLGAVFIDAENDGDLDLYVVSGGNEFNPNDSFYRDRFYENLGDGRFKKQAAAIPDLTFSGSKVRPNDFDHDGDLDLFIGGRLQPGQYPLPGSSFLLRNESEPGAIKFVDVTNDLCPEIINIGMVTDALWVDLDDDNYKELVITGEWMPIKIFKNMQGAGFQDISQNTGLKDVGLWTSLAHGDFDADGDVDLIAGNLGLNYKYKASEKEPFEIYAHDFDTNGSLDIVLGYYDRGNLYPLRGRECSSNQMSFIKEKFPTYHDFALATMKDVYGQENMSKSLNYRATNFATCFVENRGDGTFTMRPLANMAQFSSVNTILVKDFDVDGNLDLLIAGNLYQAEVETPRNDASIGLFLRGNGKGEFDPQLPDSTGLYVDGDVKNASMINISSDTKGHILIAKNNDYLQLIKITSLHPQ